MVSSNDDYALMMMVLPAALPASLLIRAPRREPAIATADDQSGSRAGLAAREPARKDRVRWTPFVRQPEPLLKV